MIGLSICLGCQHINRIGEYMVVTSTVGRLGPGSSVHDCQASENNRRCATLYYHPDGYETNRKTLMGRHAAGEAFLSALVKYAGHEKIFCFAETQKHFEHFLAKVKQAAPGPRVCNWIPWQRWQRLSESGCLFMPSPTLKELSWQRRHLSPRAYSLCGVTHTTATKAVMDGIGDLLTAPMQPWDAVVCTSHSVRSMVLEVLNNYGEYLQEHFALPQPPVVQVHLPVIPLGVHCADYDKGEEFASAARKMWRERLKIADDATALLYVGRFSSAAKAHPVPMFMALERAAKTAIAKFDLIMAGWFPSEREQKEFIAAAQLFCPSVTVHIVDGRSPEVREKIWFAADIFTSLSDNVQETFGLTPIEAMAAGLPSVVSDWDGYKETVRDGVDGFRITTWMARAGSTQLLAEAHANGTCNYDQYVGQQALVNAVDIEKAASAYVRLANDAALRAEMGANAKKHARQVFDWQIIIPQYENLWTNLDTIRKQAPEPARPSSSINPLRDDPTRLFSSYPTHHLDRSTTVSRDATCATRSVPGVLSIPMNRLAEGLALPPQKMADLIAMVADRSMMVEDIVAAFPNFRAQQIELSLLWLAKMDLIRLTEPSDIVARPAF